MASDHLFMKQFTRAESKLLLAKVKEAAAVFGYSFEVDPDGTERMIRPDGSVAVIAKRKKGTDGESAPPED